MKTINYKGKGNHSVNELELIIEQQAEELHLLRSGQKELPIHGVSVSLLDTIDQLIELYEERLTKANRNRNYIEAHNNQFGIDVLDHLKAVVKHNANFNVKA
ncbi:hypothetical protein ACJRPK_13755 [Aquimarina sp. 2-A2]|uniref:hypothetical protein n=1 Tax=Aquimarina sp. 2-A2 TaxID=3382644 RepID=UPI00387F1190